MNEKTRRWNCTDGDGAECIIEAYSAEEAAQQYIEDGEWGDLIETSWYNVMVIEVDINDEQIDPDDEGEEITVTLDPPEPSCDSEDGEHEWASPYDLLGGIKENPGCWCHGGGVIITEVCRYCGTYRNTDTWAQNPENGQQGLRSVTYREADNDSRKWVESCKPTHNYYVQVPEGEDGDVVQYDYEAGTPEDAALMAVRDNIYIVGNMVEVTVGTLSDDTSDDPGDTEQITLYRDQGEWETA